MPKSGAYATGLAAALLVLAAVAAFHNSFSGPFVFDDGPAITGNPSIRRLADLATVLNPPASGATVAGRPVLNLSLAINYAVGGLNPWGYHAVNLVIHILAGLVLFGVVRRTFYLTGRSGRSERDDGGGGWGLALAVALIWVVHPLQTESVTYVIQRAESLMGLFYLLTLYCFIRFSAEEAGRWGWGLLCIGSCLFGMGTKEVMVTAPVVVILYDRTFVSGTFREAWRRHQGLHLGLAATWVLLGWEVASTHGRGGTAGFATGIPWTLYLQTQLPAIVHYLRLALWPHPLVFDYGRKLAESPAEAIPAAGLLILLAAASAWALFLHRKIGQNEKIGYLGFPAVPIFLLKMDRDGVRALGFAGACFFLILAPSSSVVPVATEIVAEHRMYLPLAAVVAVVVAGIARAVRRVAFGELAVLGAVTLALIAATVRRNETYRTEAALWRDTLAKQPDNALAHYDLGVTLVRRGDREAAKAQFEQAVHLAPDYVDAWINLGNVRLKEGRTAEAALDFRKALAYKPRSAEAHNDLGIALASSGDPAQAIAEFDEALRLQPSLAEAYRDRANALTAEGRGSEAFADYHRAVDLNPDDAAAQAALAAALTDAGQLGEAVEHYRKAVSLDPGIPETHYNLGNLLGQSGDAAGAIVQYQVAIRLRPGYAEAHANLGAALANSGRVPEGLAELTEAARLAPGNAQIQSNLGQLQRALAGQR